MVKEMFLKESLTTLSSVLLFWEHLLCRWVTYCLPWKCQPTNAYAARCFISAMWRICNVTLFKNKYIIKIIIFKSCLTRSSGITSWNCQNQMLNYLYILFEFSFSLCDPSCPVFWQFPKRLYVFLTEISCLYWCCFLGLILAWNTDAWGPLVGASRQICKSWLVKSLFTNKMN